MNSGTYNYFLNGEPTGVSETFDIKILSDGSKFTTSIRDAKPFKSTITVETVEKDDKFQNCQIVYQKDEFQIEAVYEFTEKDFHVWRKINGETVQDESFDLPENSIFFPLMRCFQGKTILQVADNKDVTTVIVPDIQPSTNFDNLLRPTFDERSANLITKEDNLFIYNYLSKHYDDNSEFHLDENGLLICYKFVQNEQQTWEVKLTS